MNDPGAILVLGLSHHTARLAAREQAALGDAASRAVMRDLLALPHVHEAVALSTCNRTEIYAVAGTVAAGEQALRGVLLRHTLVGAATLEGAGYMLCDNEAVEHLFRVAVGLESAVLGEAEIAGQVRAAARRARDEGALGPLLSGAFEHALAAARRVRRRTRIGVGATSVASLVAQLVGDARAGHDAPRVAVVGAGRLARAVAGAVAAQRPRRLVIVNRSAGAARAIADRHAAETAPLDRLDDELATADAVVCATGAPQAIVSGAAVRRAVGARPRPLLVVDLAVPRDVDAAAASVAGVTLYDIDAVQELLRQNVAARRAESEAAGALVRTEVERFTAWRQEVEAAATVALVWRQAERLRRAELARLAAELDAEELMRLDALSAQVLKKLLHGPAERLRAACARAGGRAHLESVRALLDASGANGATVIQMPRRDAA